ncbi:MAG: CBS and ACT domain-containing protein [Syntrophobacteraceae bacterium]|nr:CBS and ACT domain-containing protein [Syntrophobacteraceae bacterium]
MLVRNWMTKDPFTVDEDASIQDASKIMREHKVRMLPVLKDGKLTGMLSDSDLKRASASDATLLDIHELLYLISKIKVRDIMSKPAVTVPEDFTVEETAQILMEQEISGVAVTNGDGKLVGIITRYDIFKILTSLSGLGKKGVQFAFRIDDTPGSIKLLTDVVRQHEGRIASILTGYEYAPEGKRIVYLRVYGIERAVLPEVIRELGEKGALIYCIDHQDNKRHVFLDEKA